MSKRSVFLPDSFPLMIWTGLIRVMALLMLIQNFTMDMMLQSLNIDLDVIGYDKELQRWM